MKRKSRKERIFEYYQNPKYCLTCGNILHIKDNENTTEVKRRKFCNKTCSAKTLNLGVRRNYKGGETNLCLCGEQKQKKSQKCVSCKKKEYDNLSLATILKDGKYSSTKLTNVRRRARQILLESNKIKHCSLCEHSDFDTIVEACHIKSIMSFDLQSLVLEINDINNLVWLCPSHHALYDKGLIKLKI